MPELKVIDQVGNKNQIFFSATVGLKTDQNKQKKYRIVGPDETDTNQDDISIDSPLARALLKKQVGGEVHVLINQKPSTYKVVSIDYDS
jgi:transcription elongation factor GreB